MLVRIVRDFGFLVASVSSQFRPKYVHGMITKETSKIVKKKKETQEKK